MLFQKKSHLEDDQTGEEVPPRQASQQAEHWDVLVVVQREADVAEEQEERQEDLE